MNPLSAAHWRPPGGTWTPEAEALAFAAASAATQRQQEYTRLYTRRGTVAHLSPPWGHRGYVLCPVHPQWPDDWLGTGSQPEYERAAALPACSRCRHVFMDSQRCGNPECPCQQWGVRELAGVKR